MHLCNVTGLVLLLMPVEVLLGLLDPVAGQQSLVRGTRRETIEMRMPTNRAPLCWASVVHTGLIQATENGYITTSALGFHLKRKPSSST